MFYFIKSTLHKTTTTHLIPKLLGSRASYSFSRKKRVRDLDEVKISLSTAQQSQSIEESIKPNYVGMHQEITKLNWQSMQFDKLCGLPERTLSLINMQIKKDKFNVDDSEFYSYSLNHLDTKFQDNKSIQQKLNTYYLRLYHLLNNNFQQYDQISQIAHHRHYYQNQMYIMDLEKNKKLKEVIQYFINHISQPNKLDIVAQPSFIKHLLSIKRELILQGAVFQSSNQSTTKNILKATKDPALNIPKQQETDQLKKQEDQDIDFIQEQQQIEYKKTKIDEYIKDTLKNSKINVKIVRVLGYQYEFWVDVKHNRTKNGVQQDYIIQQRQIDNPNQSMLVKESFPKIKVTYIVHKKKRKDYSMHFCIKSSLVINVDGSQRNIKVQWRGPSNNYKENTKDVQFIIIDYENLMKGNATIKPIFYF